MLKASAANRQFWLLWVWASALAGPLFVPSTLTAQESVTAVDFLSAEEEQALALSAAPEHLKGGATAYVLGPEGFSVSQEGTNGYSCVVNRDHPRNRKPTCYDSEGTRTILPKVLFMGEMMALGASMSAISDSVSAGFADGRWGAPQRSGVAFMLSDGIRRYNSSTGEYSSFPPHVMFYAPDVSNADLGTDWDAVSEHDWMPFIAYQGPHGMLVVKVEP